MSMRTLKLLSVLLGFIASHHARAQNCPSRSSWPTDAWPIQLVDSQAKADAIKNLEDYAFTLTGTDGERLGYRTDSLLVVKNGVIIYERYARGYDETKRHLTWSVMKSISSALIGVAVKNNALTLSDSICQHLTEYANTPQCAITVKDAITFGTGLQWQEEYENKGYQVSSVIAMLLGVGHRNQLAHILGHPLVTPPGQQWQYSTGDAALAAALAKRALTKVHGQDAFWSQLFNRIGMSRMTVEEDLQGNPSGGAMGFATPRDFARFGFLFLNDGCWNGERVLPEGWVSESTTVSDVFATYSSPGNKTPSGFAWWLNKPVPQQGKEKPWPDVPEGAYAAMGHWGQLIVVVPSEDVVIVRTGDDRKGSIKLNDLAKFALEVAR